MMIVSLYGLFCIVGGVIGFLKAASLASLLAGTLSGLLLIGLSFRLQKRWAAVAVLLISLALCIRFSIGLVSEFRIMPHLIMVVLSVLSSATAVVWLSRGARRSA